MHEWTAEVFAATDRDLAVGAQYRLMIRTERDEGRGARQVRRDRDPSVHRRARSPRSTRSTRPRPHAGAAPSRGWWEDVEDGDAVGPIVKGPLRVTDMVCWHVGMGMGLYGVKALRLGYEQRQQVPALLPPRRPQHPRRAAARALGPRVGAPRRATRTTYDYGRMRETWLIHLCTDWMGDDAWLWKLDCQFRKFNYVGDTHWLRGTVVRKYLADGDRPAVDLELEGENQRGDVTTPGHATILLPSREHGPVRLPDPPEASVELRRPAHRARRPLRPRRLTSTNVASTNAVAGSARFATTKAAGTGSNPPGDSTR